MSGPPAVGMLASAMRRIELVVAWTLPYADKVTPFKFRLLRAETDAVALDIGLPSDQFRYLLCLFLTYPMAVVYKLLPSATLKHLFDITMGVFIAQFVLESAWVHSFVTALVTYLLVKYGPRKYAPYIVFVFNMAYMTASHIYRLYVDYMGWTLDFTGPQMLLVLKLTSFAYNYYDGVVDKTADEEDLSPALARVHASRQRFAIQKLPSLLEFFGYVYSFPTFLAGPAFEIREYLDVTSSRKFMFDGKLHEPSSSFAAFSKLLVGTAALAIFARFGPVFPLANLHDPKNGERSLLWQIGNIYITTLVSAKLKYYSAWKIAEGSTVLSGFGFEGFNKDGSPRGWNGVSNMDIASFELAQSIRDVTRAWNKGTQNWLERYVYSRNGNSLTVTYFVSAFWHGFYPGYYLFFLSLPLPTAINRLAHKRVRPYFLEKDGSSGTKKKLYDIFSFLITAAAYHYFVLPFHAMSLENSVQTLRNMKFSGHIIAVILFCVLHLVPAKVATEKKIQ